MPSLSLLLKLHIEPEKTADISLHHHWFPREMTSEKQAQEFHTDVTTQIWGTASDWLKSCFIQLKTLPDIWVVTRHQYGISAFTSQTSSRGETSCTVASLWASRNFGCFLDSRSVYFILRYLMAANGVASKRESIRIMKLQTIHITFPCQSHCAFSWRYTVGIPRRSNTHCDGSWFPCGLHHFHYPLSFFYKLKILSGEG